MRVEIDVVTKNLGYAEVLPKKKQRDRNTILETANNEKYGQKGKVAKQMLAKHQNQNTDPDYEICEYCKLQ